MVERLKRLSISSDATSIIQEGVGNVIVIASCATAAAALIVPDLIFGFLTLLRSVLESLFLPCKLLFDLASWLSGGSSVQSAVSSVDNARADATHVRALHAYFPTVMIIIGLMVYFFNEGSRNVATRFIAPGLHTAAAFLIFSPIALLLFPAICIEAISTIESREKNTQSG
ncbi:hypothetical protein [Acetobacter nitrogenifigens]|uniref:Uncharacterized protein n=1 Tax=Acetobacter nitrogenifigens DSM 23921 = NBRC 105050 TaxID=1120919 RepID=A0A511XAU7_9PROT|nr:hypothetical protein [Acetobacter nitrogenifigens]GEN60045.1 hypothetical protein ANI02nite_19290 [Acetobacter nitrogenifigens DSM 23921 = NBRC 105050]